MAQIPSLSFKPKHDPVQASLELIEADLSKTLTINWVASQVGVSPFHFQRKFTQDIGETVAGYIRSRRLEAAAKLLLAPERTSLIEIALDCGFQTHSAFTRAFSRHFGITPKQFAAGSGKILQQSVGSSRPFLKPVPTAELALSVDTLHMPKLWLLSRHQAGTKNGSFFADSASIAHDLKQLIAERPANLLSLCGAFKTGPREFSDPTAIGNFGGLFDRKPTSAWGNLHDSIDAGEWAAISHTGRYDRLHMTWNKALQSWLPRSGYQLRNDWMFEFYYASPSDPERNSLTAQILLPIEKTA
ncbi:AraC family transcriptional regulator [uncultured Litoreibacter sp.]|uniref:AraC family transcriptional regulator n=1 Tax=uncultured Litoreibacter sp. TaxID=1392394 RepID=UPI002630D2BA|nr:AraC family transcriptional regulator [uncultured Litoreibacter sp.]